MSIDTPLSVLGIVVGVLLITSGGSLAASGYVENDTSEVRHKPVCVDYTVPEPGTTGSGCAEWDTLTYGEESPGNDKLVGGGVVVLLGGVSVFFSTRT